MRTTHTTPPRLSFPDDAPETGASSVVAVSRIDHIGIVVDNLSEAVAFVRNIFGLSEESRIERPDLRALFFACGSMRIELIEVLDASHRTARLGDDRARIEHIAFVVHDFEQALDGLRRHGVETTETRESQGRRTCWSIPSTTDDVVYQLVEELPRQD